jgi:hypothetical protein
VQAAPLPPQWDRLGVVQTPFSQQPFGHEPGPHVQLPLTHSEPSAQMGPLPQTQPPPAHPSARLPQSMQEAPLRPHSDPDVGKTQAVPLQQPGQETASQVHRPLKQCWPAPH